MCRAVCFLRSIPREFLGGKVIQPAALNLRKEMKGDSQGRITVRSNSFALRALRMRIISLADLVEYNTVGLKPCCFAAKVMKIMRIVSGRTMLRNSLNLAAWRRKSSVNFL